MNLGIWRHSGASGPLQGEKKLASSVSFGVPENQGKGRTDGSHGFSSLPTCFALKFSPSGCGLHLKLLKTRARQR